MEILGRPVRDSARLISEYVVLWLDACTTKVHETADLVSPVADQKLMMLLGPCVRVSVAGAANDPQTRKTWMLMLVFER